MDEIKTGIKIAWLTFFIVTVTEGIIVIIFFMHHVLKIF